MKEKEANGLQAAIAVQLFLEQLRSFDLVTPCHECGYPTVTPLTTEDGHIECFECEAEKEEENGED